MVSDNRRGLIVGTMITAPEVDLKQAAEQQKREAQEAEQIAFENRKKDNMVFIGDTVRRPRRFRQV
jgi:hypothetical protein